MKLQFMWANIQPCNAQITVFFNWDAFNAFCDKNDLVEMKELGDVGEQHNGSFISNDKQPFMYVMVLPEMFQTETVYHEALHCAMTMWEQAGAELHMTSNQEVLTYTQTHIVQQIQALYETKEEIENGDKNKNV